MVHQQELSAYLCPHPLKDTAAGRPVIMLPLILFTDDTSGNKSKKWHKFDSWSLMLASLPRHENSQTSNIHFIAVLIHHRRLDMSTTIVAGLLSVEKEGVEPMMLSWDK